MWVGGKGGEDGAICVGAGCMGDVEVSTTCLWVGCDGVRLTHSVLASPYGVGKNMP